MSLVASNNEHHKIEIRQQIMDGLTNLVIVFLHASAQSSYSPLSSYDNQFIPSSDAISLVIPGKVVSIVYYMISTDVH